MILLCTYQCFHRIHCHSAFIAIDYTTSKLNADLDAMIDVEILKISRDIFVRIRYFPLHQLKISKSIASFH